VEHYNLYPNRKQAEAVVRNIRMTREATIIEVEVPEPEPGTVGVDATQKPDSGPLSCGYPSPTRYAVLHPGRIRNTDGQ
jgi:hypothetical protein